MPSLNKFKESTEYAENIATNGFEDASLNDEEFLTDNSSERNTSSLNIDEINWVKEEQNETMNHSSKEIWEQLKKDDRFCDVTLDCDDWHIKTHKLIISSYSPFISLVIYYLYLLLFGRTLLSFLMVFHKQPHANLQQLEAQKHQSPT